MSTLPSAAVPYHSPQRVSKVLLLDGYSTRSLACVRSWGKKGVDFAVGGETAWDMSLFSRYTNEKFVYTSPKLDVGRFVQDVNRYCRKFRADAIFPTSEAGIMACSTYRNELAATPIIPSEDTIKVALSKANTLALAESLGLAVPKTLHVTAENRSVLDTCTLAFPVVVKSSSSAVMVSGKTATSPNTFYASNQAELRSECDSRIASGQSVLVQEFIDGYGVGVSGLFRSGQPVALLAHRRIRESNPTGGPSAVAETIELTRDLLTPTKALMGRIGFTGPAMAEYRVDRRTGVPYLMEINGRFWGSVLLASIAGLDLPYLYWKLLNGMEIGADEKAYRLGVRGRYLIGDTKCLLLCLKGKPANWPGEIPSRGAAISSYLKSFLDRQTHELIFSAEDPLPYVGRLIQPNS
jgi:predicted ATP-grasp superfamily ATP-dependent carboligase